MRVFGLVILVDKEKAEKWARDRGIDLYWNGWKETEIFGHKVMVTYVGDDSPLLRYMPCPFCRNTYSRECDDTEHIELFEELIKEALIDDVVVWNYSEMLFNSIDSDDFWKEKMEV